MRQHYMRAAAGYRINQPAADTGDQHIANTELLLQGEGSNGQTNNTFVDSSASSHSITRVGDPTQGSFSPFSPKGWSGYFNGSSDYLSWSASHLNGEFTWEVWVYPTHTDDRILFSDSGYSNIQMFRLNYGSSGTITFYNGQYVFYQIDAGVKAFEWTHLALSRGSDNVTRLFVNGVQKATANNTYGWRPNKIGQMFYNGNVSGNAYEGYMSNMRIVHGTQLYSSNFDPPTEPLTAVTNTKLLTLQDNRIVDNSVDNNTITRIGDVSIKATSPFSGNREYPKASYFSGYFDGQGNHSQLDVVYTNSLSADFDLSGNISSTLECWVYLTAYPSTTQTSTDPHWGAATIFSIKNSNIYSARYYHYTINTSGQLGMQADYGSGSFPGTGKSTSTLSLNTWYHIAWVRDSGSNRFFLNGTEITSEFSTPNASGMIGSGNSKISIGADYYASSTLNWLRPLTGYISNFRVVKGTALYTANFTPPTAPLTPVANTKLLTLQDNYLIDHSSSSHSITTNGSVTLVPESPFDNSTYPLSGTFYSGYVDGNGDTFEITNSSDFDFGTGDFTLECWFNISSFGSVGALCLWDNYNGSQGARFNWNVGTDGGGVDSSGGMNKGTQTDHRTVNVQANEWHHTACVRDSTGLKFYLDGELFRSYATSPTEAYTPTNNNPRIGDYSDNYVTGAGYISNFRVVKGQAVYTSDFTVPTEPLTAIPGTVLLTLQDATVQDNSASSHSMTTNGNATITEIAPFGAELIDRAGSMYFDGDGDYLRCDAALDSLTSASDPFTIEAWFYCNSVDSSVIESIFGVNYNNGQLNNLMVSVRDVSGTPNIWLHYLLSGSNQIDAAQGAFSLHAWNHIAASYDGTTFRLYLNGSQLYSTTGTPNNSFDGCAFCVGAELDSTNVAGNYFDGYITDVRIVKSALYTSNFTPPTAPLQPITNTKLLLSGNNGGVEDSLGKRTFETDGNAQIDTTVKKFGSGAIEFDGNGDYLKGTGFDLSGKYTIEGWVYRRAQSGNQRIYVQCGSTWNWASTGVHSSMFFRANTNTLVFELAYGQNSSPFTYTIETSTAPAVNTWHYFAVTCDGTNTSLFLNGARVGTTPNILPANWPNGLTTEFSIGNDGGISATSSNNHFNGFLDDFRVTVGVARYDPTQTSHTVPTKTHPTI